MSDHPKKPNTVDPALLQQQIEALPEPARTEARRIIERTGAIAALQIHAKQLQDAGSALLADMGALVHDFTPERARSMKRAVARMYSAVDEIEKLTLAVNETPHTGSAH